jgi:hypothetical protein
MDREMCLAAALARRVRVRDARKKTPRKRGR